MRDGLRRARRRYLGGRMTRTAAALGLAGLALLIAFPILSLWLPALERPYDEHRARVRGDV